MDGRVNERIVKGVTAAILITSFAYAFANSITAILINEIVDAFFLTGAAQGLLSSMLSLGQMVAFLLNPVFQGRVSKMTLLLLSGLLQVVMLLVSGFAPTFALFALAMVILGIGGGWLDSGINSGMIDYHPTDNTKYLGLLHGIYGVGSLLAPLVIQWLLLTMIWRSVLCCIAGLLLLAMVLVALVRRGSRGAEVRESVREERLTPAQVWAYLKNGRNLLLLGCAALTAMVQTGVNCWIVRYMLLAHDQAALGAACVTVYWIAATINRFAAPRLKIRPLVMLLGGSLLAALFLGAGILIGNAVVMCVCVGLVGLVTGHFMPMIVSVTAEGYRGSTTLTTSMTMFVMGVVRVILPLAMAALTDAVSVGVGMSLPAIAGVLAAMMCAAALRQAPRKEESR